MPMDGVVRQEDETGGPPKEADDISAYEVDGWERGFDVEMNGVGIIEVRDGDDDSSDWESDVTEEEYCPAGYTAIPSECPDHDSCVPKNVDDSEDVPCSSTSEKEGKEETEKKINLGEEKIAGIKKAMAGIQMNVPEWATHITDSQLVDMVKSLGH